MDDLRYGDLFSDVEELDALASDRMTLLSAPRPRLYGAFPLIALAMIIWATALTVYFYKQNPALPWVFVSLLDFGDYHFGALARFPLLELGFGLAGLTLMWAVGRLFMGGYESYLPPAAHHCIAFTLGIGLSGVILTLLTLAHLHYQIPVIAMWVVLIGWLWIRMVRRQRRLDEAGGCDHDVMTNIETERAVRRAMAHKQFEHSILRPRGWVSRLMLITAMTLLILISLLTLWHALFYPETYWDSLILYLGWARKIFTQHHFPNKVVAQVGVGLGANYPHLYELQVAGIATLFNHWSDLYGRLLSPVAALAAVVLVYQTALYLTRSRLTAAAAALAVRTVPAGIAYSIYASNYALAILFFAAFLYIGMVYIDTGRRPYLVFLTLITAFAMHINYLMGILWAAWVAVVIMAHWRGGVFNGDRGDGRRTQVFFEGRQSAVYAQHPFQIVHVRPTLQAMVRRGRLWRLLAVGLVIGSIWYGRNWIVTGNPVYAFFPNIFGGKNINPEVLDSAYQEWLQNGDGIERYALQRYKDTSLKSKFRGTWGFFVTSNLSWKWAPVWMGLAVPGMILALLLPVLRRAIHPRNDLERLFIQQMLSPTLLRSGALAVVMTGLLLFYHYFISGIYLYQIICILPMWGVFGTLALHTASLAGWRGVLRLGLVGLITAWGVVPGMAFGLMGLKWKSEAVMAGQRLHPISLYHFRRPMMDPEVFYRLEFGDEVDMWNYVNKTLKGRKILTHENRNLLYDETITFVHLDDWDMQSLYRLSDPAARVAFIRGHGIEHYLYLPMEDKSPINKRAGMEELKQLGYLRQDYARGGMVLYYISDSPGGPGGFDDVREGWGPEDSESSISVAPVDRH
ncbi:MAG: hypothetical protein Kow0059_07520 [Candidatus Sumerlaeia bacterium]